VGYLLLTETVGRAETVTTIHALVEEINGAYRRLSAATEALLRADRSLSKFGIRLDNAEAILDAKNERTASL
jgi:hypothetical protein